MWGWILLAASTAGWLAILLATRRSAARRFATFADVIASFREGDFSIRARAAPDAATAELNALGDELHRQRLEAMESSQLLEKIVESADVAVFALDERARLRLANREGERLLGRARRELIGRAAMDLGLGELLSGDAPRTVSFPANGHAWELRRSPFRLEGRAHTLVVLTPLDRALRERERDAWYRLLRVLGHEINNSLAPIRSLAVTSLDLIRRSPRPEDADADIARGLAVIQSRAEALGRLTTSFAELARLPAPVFGEVSIAAWVEGSATAETRLPVAVDPGPALTLRGDADQLDQLLLNLVRNAADAVIEAGSGGVRVTWAARGAEVTVRVIDDGAGIAHRDNLFVPFFTTKPSGSGLGLTIARQIAEAHGGTLALEDRTEARGCEARLVLPLSTPGSRG